MREEGGVKFSWGHGRGPPPHGPIGSVWTLDLPEVCNPGGTRTPGVGVLQSCPGAEGSQLFQGPWGQGYVEQAGHYKETGFGSL